MAIKRIVSTEFWTDAKVVEDFTPEDKYFFLYLLTNPHTTQLGIYSFTAKIAAFEMGYSVDAIKALLERFDKKHGLIKISETTGEIAIRNYLKHSIVKGGFPVRDLLLKEAGLVKDKALLNFVLQANRENGNVTVLEVVNILLNDNDNDNDESPTIRPGSENCKEEPKKSCSYKQIKNEILENKNTGLECEWCGAKTSVLHRHHYPVPKRLGGRETVQICSNCHAEFHVQEGKIVGGRNGDVQEVDDKFNMFWTAYPRKTAKPKARAAFKKLNPDDALVGVILAAIEAQKGSSQWLKDKGQFIPHPATWLNQERWTDEVPENDTEGAWDAWKAL